MFGGKEISVALSKMSFEPQYFGAYEKTKLSLAEMDTLNGWFDFMKKRYKIVGQLAGSKKDD